MKWLSKYSFRTRLIIGFSFTIVLNMASIGYSLYKINHVQIDLKYMYEHTLLVSSALENMNGKIHAIHVNMLKILLNPKKANSTDKEISLIAKYDEEIKKDFNIIFERHLGDIKIVKMAQKLYLEWKTLRKKELNLYKENNSDKALILAKTKGLSLTIKITTQNSVMVDFAQNKATQLYYDNIKDGEKVYRALIIMASSLGFLSIVIALIIATSISKPLKKMGFRLLNIKDFQLENVQNISNISEQKLLEMAVTQLEKSYQKTKNFNEALKKEVALKTKDLKNTNIIIKKSEKELFQKNQFFEKLITKTPLGFVYFDTNGIIKMWNHAASTIFGYSAKEALGKNIVDLVVPKDIVADINQVLKALLDETGGALKQNENLTKNGKSILCHWYNAVIKDSHNKVIGITCIVEDVTLSTKTQQDLIETNQSLQDMVYIASHDLQVPLVSMEGYASEVLTSQKDKLDEEGVYCLTRLQSNVVRMHKLVLSLLDISRLNTQINPYQKFSLNTLFKKIIKDISLTIEENKATVNFKNLPTIYADKQRIESVLRNLLTNALNYEAKQIDITFKNGVLAVADDGIGVPQTELKKIFFPGERLKMNKAEGVGMGLAFCEKVIKKHQGTIWATSKGLNKGTTINIQFNKTSLIV